MPQADSSPSDLLSRIRGTIARGRWWILLTTAAVTLATIAWLYQIPNRYMSAATLLVVPQQVPTRYVTPTSETPLSDALEAMTQDVLSRGRLQTLIDEFGLYARERRRLAPEEVIDLMRSYISIEPIETSDRRRGEINAFRISFVAERAALAQQVTSKLTSFFIQANLKTREDQATNTTNFLASELDAARANLATAEEKMRDFKTEHLGELPEQQQSNLAIFNAAQQQLQNLQSSLDNAQQQRVYLESLISGYQRLAARGASTPGTIPGVTTARPLTPLQAAQSELARLELERVKLLTTYSPINPEVKSIDRQIAAAHTIIDRLKGSEAAHSGNASEAASAAPVTQDTWAEDTSITQLQSQLEANRLDIQNIQKSEAQQKMLLAEYQNRLNMTPVREQQLAGITRDYDLSKQEYTDLVGKEQQSQLATSLEKQQGGQQFRLVEPPSLPELPSSPERLKLSFAGLGGGLFLGLVIAFIADLARPTYHSTQEITRRLGAPLVIGLPVILTRSERRRQSVRKGLELATGSAIAVLMCVAELYVLRHP